jgi:glutaredoxin
MAEERNTKDGGCVTALKDIYNNSISDIISYINEYGNMYNLIIEDKEVAKSHREAIVNGVKQNDVVIYAKAGCGFCERAKKLIYAKQSEFQQEDSGRYAFSVHVALGTESGIKSALGSLLDLNDVTYPQIIVKGVYVGGSDNMTKWVEGEPQAGSSAATAFKQMLEADNSLPIDATRIPWYGPLVAEAATPNLFAVPIIKGTWYPSDWPWYAFQWCMYGNLVRYISILQLAAMIPICLLFSSSYNDNPANIFIAKALLAAFLVDLALLVVHGPTPFSPSGAISTYFGWRVRGNATSSVPYKVVFLAYIIGLLPYLLRPYTSESARYSGISNAMIALITNSTILVVFRF